MRISAVGFLLSALASLFIPLIPTLGQTPASQSWVEVNRSHEGAITVYWYESRPFIYGRSNGQMAGIEFEILQNFKKYLLNKYGITLTINFRKAESFSGLYQTIRDKKQPGSIGASAFSITDERREAIDFSPAYMSDITVLITSNDLPIARDVDEFNSMLPELTAVSIKETTYEQELLRMRAESEKPFAMKYIHSSENILRTIQKMDSAFGFIDLPVYLLLFNEDPSLNVKRQNVFTIKREGYALVYPKHSDWGQPINEYFSDPNFKSELEAIIARYIDMDLYRFVEGLTVQDDRAVQLLTKEKEIQSKDLVSKTQQIIAETRKKNFLIALMGVILVSLVTIVILYRKRNEQKLKIEAQQKNIELKSQQLEKRNQRLLALDEEKNNLIKILAHDLRTPINHVQGLAHVFLLSNEDLPEDQKAIITQIMDASVRLNKMITHLLDIDALENDRVTVFMDNVDASSLVRQVVVSFEKPALKKEIEISFSSSPEACCINGDSLFLIQIFENLISNAIKFSQPGKKIQVAVRENADKILISVKDEGPGLTPDDMENLFKKFHRLSAKPTSGESSLGLGLSIVKKYVELMKGRVWCESVLHIGTTFHVEFPKAANAKK